MNPTTGTLWETTAFDTDARWHDDGGIATTAVDLDTASGRPWPAVHPGVHDAAGGLRAHRVVASFTLGEATSATLLLRFSVERGPCPDLEIVLDGVHRGIFHPEVDRMDRSGTGEPGPIAGRSGLEIFFPASWLTAGRHTLSVTTVFDEAAAIGEEAPNGHRPTYRPTEALPEARGHYGNWFGSFIRWSSVSLVSSHVPERVATYSIRPTPFFVLADGEVRELVDQNVAWAVGSAPPQPITLDWHGSVLVAPAPPADREFGMFRWRFVAPPFDTATSVRVTAAGRTDTHVLTPARKWNMHLIPHVHLDVGFTDAQGKVLELHCRNIDRALDRMKTDPGFRFSVDGSVVIREYTLTRSPARVSRMRDAIESGTLGVNAFHSNFLTGIVGLEELYRSTDYALTLPRSARTQMRYANLTDVPTCTSSVPAVLSALGIRGFVGMANHGRAATVSSDDLHLLSPVRWRGPDGSEVLAHFADHYSQLRFVAGDPQSVGAGANGLDRLLSRFDRADYLPTDLAIIGTHADNEDVADGDTGFVERWNARFAFPRFQVSTFDEYLAAIAPLADRLPVWRGEGGSYWEDGTGSAAAEFASYRRTQALLPAAETLGAAISAIDDTYRTNRVELDRGWEGLSIAAEHTLTWARSTAHPHAFPVADQLGWKARHIEDAARVAVDEMRRHLAQLAEVVDATGPGFLAYNPHPWTADLEGEIDLAEGIAILDADVSLPFEVLSDCAGMRRCRIPLPAMPAHSYRFLPSTASLDTVPGGETAPQGVSTGAHPASVAPSSGSTIETPGWIVELDPATSLPRRLSHRVSGRELLDDRTDIALGQLIRTAATPSTSAGSATMSAPDEVHGHARVRIDNLEDYGTTTPRVDLLSESPTLTLVGVKATFDGVRLRWKGSGAGLESVVTDLLLRDDSESCDLEVRFTKRPCLDMEAIYVAFPFAANDPTLRYDRQLGWVTPATDHGPGASNEWGALTNTVSIASVDGEIRWSALDAPLFAAGDVVRGLWPSSFSSPNGHVFSYVMNNFWPCNTPPSQEGEVVFRYRFAIAESFDPAASSRFGRVARVGAQVAEITPLERYRPGGGSSFVEGRLLDLAADEYTDVQLRQRGEKDRMHLLVTNFAAEERITALRIPDGLQLDEGDTAPVTVTADERGGIHIVLPGFGMVRVALRR